MRAVYLSFVLICLSINLYNYTSGIQKNETFPDQPNVLIIMTDQQSYNMMSFSGNKYLNTPNLDKLARRGYSFDRTYTTNPVCQPSRFSLMTGHYSSTVGIKENYRSERRPRYEAYDSYLQKNYVFDTSKVNELKKNALGNIFRTAGYKTYYAGKGHLYTGFSGWGFDLLSRDPYNGTAKAAENILTKMSKTEQPKPFLLFLSFMQPHDICYQGYLPDKKDPNEINRYRRIQKSMKTIDYLKQLPPRKDMNPIKGENPNMFAFVSHHRDWKPKDWDLYRWLYNRLTESVDEQIGRVLNALKESGLHKNTIVVFTSDHGDMQGAHGLVWKNVLLEEAQRVPFIFAGPGIRQNYVDTSTLVCNGLDLLPTICELAGIQKPNGIPGISLKSYLTGSGTTPKRKYIYAESFNAFQINDGRYKYTVYEISENPEMLTDLKVDPEENINFADYAEYKKTKVHLKQKLMTHLSKRKLTPLPEDRYMKYLTPTRIAH